MIKKINIWLNKPYPFYETYRQKIIIPAIFALSVMLVLIILNPSHNSDIVSEQFFKVLAYGFITFTVMLLFSLIIPIIFPEICEPQKWKVKKSINYSLLTIITVGLLNGFFAYKYDNTGTDSHIILFIISVMIKTFTVAFFPFLIFVFYRERSLYKKHHLKSLEVIDELKKSNKKESKKEEKILISSPVTKDEVEISKQDLYCIKSEGNYCMIFYNNNNSVNKKLIRISLNNIEKALKDYEEIIRCHKSFIINLDKVNSISGNARGYSFIINEPEFKIPGSRNLSKTLISAIRDN